MEKNTTIEQTVPPQKKQVPKFKTTALNKIVKLINSL